jgi:hypothetical protein
VGICGWSQAQSLSGGNGHQLSTAVSSSEGISSAGAVYFAL